MTLGNARLMPSAISIDASVGGSATSEVGFCTYCCPLPLAANDADFMNSLLWRFGSGSIGVSLNSCDADAAGVTVLPLSFF